MTVQLRLGLATPPALGGDDFVEAPSNAEARARVSDWRGWPGPAFALHGPPGSGKTHLAQLWAAEADASRIDDLSVPASGQAVWIDAIDRRLQEDPQAGEQVFHLINRAARGEGALLLVARGAPVDWPSPLPDLRSRFNALAAAELGEPDDDLLRRLLVKFFRERSIKPSADLLDYLARRIERSATSAAQVVDRLDAASRAGARLGLPLAREILRDADGVDDDEALRG